MSLVRKVEDDRHFRTELASAGTKLVVVYFTAPWCRPCRNISPTFENLSTKYPNAIFLEVNVDRCAITTGDQGVRSVPTFLFYRNRAILNMCRGADPSGLEAKIIEFYDPGSGDRPVAGHMDLSSFILKGQCECLNESDDHTFEKCLTADSPGYLESDCDEQLIISLTFTQAVKVHSLKIKAPADKGPKNLKIFINQLRTLDFDSASSTQSVQDVTLTPQDCEEGNPVLLRYVKFQNVMNLQIFVEDNQTGSETTQINHLAIIGSPIATTKMEDFKRVAGAKGESH